MSLRRITTHWSFWPLAIALVLRVSGIWWGLPGSDGWDNDGIAPRDLYPGLAATFTPGEFYTYPPFHLIVLGILCSPVLLLCLLSAPSLELHDVVRTMLEPGYMTAISCVARAVSLMLSLATTYLVADLARRTSGPRAARIAAWVGALHLGFAYYGKTSNLDVACVFYAVLAVWFLTRDQLRPNARHKVLAALAAAAAVSTKDQAYANFVLVLPACVLASLWLARGTKKSWLRALIAGGAAYAAASSLVFNPVGFRARLAFLRGPASQDFTLYSSDLRGRALLLEGVLDNLDKAMGSPVLMVALGGVAAVCLQKVRPARRVARLLPGLAALSFFLFFNCVALRNEDRFVLSIGAFLAYYAGLGVAFLDARLQGQLALPVRYLLPALLLPAAVRAVALDAALLGDPRHAVERWLGEHVTSTVETYGNNVYLPRFPAGQRVVRVSSPDAAIRSPMPGVHDIQAPFGEAESRRPDVLVVPHAYVWRYLPLGEDTGHGRVVPSGVKRLVASDDGSMFFRELFAGRLAYREILRAECDTSIWPAIFVHASVCEAVSVFVRTPAP